MNDIYTTQADKDRWQKISAALDEALDLDDADRARWLAELAGHDPAFARDVEQFLDSRAAIDDAGFLATPPGMAPPALVGQAIGDWVLESPVGQGGMGAVWLARRADNRFEGKAAVKLLNMSLVGQDGERRFKREGTILATLAHPHIARLLDAGIAQTGQPYLILEYVDGQHIDAYCDAKNLDIEARVRLFLDVLAAVAHAHTNLIVHRDLKPSNVLIANDGNVKLLDFGIAKLIVDDPSVSAITREGSNALTPEFAAPEQLLGQPITTATDVYSLGVLLYLLLGGQHPNGNTNLPPAELVKAIVETAPPLVSDAVSQTKTIPLETLSKNAAHRAATTDKLKRLLRGDLDNIIAKALKKNPAERYASVSAFADDLHKYLEHEPVTARPESFGYRAGKFVRRHRGGVAVGLLTIVAIGAGVIGTITQTQRANEQARMAMSQYAYSASTIDFVRTLLGERGRKSYTTQELLERAEQMVNNQFANDPAVKARILATIGENYASVGDLSRAQLLFQQARTAAQAANDSAFQISIECGIAAAHIYLGKPESAPRLFEPAISGLQAKPDIDSSVLSACLAARGEYFEQAGRLGEAQASFQEAVAILGTPRADQWTRLINARVSLAGVSGRLGMHAKAVDEFAQTINDLTRLGRQNTSGALAPFHNYGVVLTNAGQLFRAEKAYQQAIEIAKAASGSDEISPSQIMNFAEILFELGRIEESKQWFERALKEAKLRKVPRLIGFTSLKAAKAWCVTGDLRYCDELFIAAQETLQPMFPPGHVVFGALANLAGQRALAHLQPTEARLHFQRALDIFRLAPDKGPNLGRTLSMLARTEQQLGDSEAAKRHAAEGAAFARQSSLGIASSVWLGQALLAQGAIQKAQSDSAAKVTLLEGLDQLRNSVGDQATATKEAQALLVGL